MNMNRKAQVRWVIIAVLIVVIAGLLFYHDITVKYLGILLDYTKPITGYATGIAEKAVHGILNTTK